MKERLNVLVLGVGGNVSQGILKALEVCSVPCRVIGGCVSPLSAGLYTTERSYISPMANEPHFFEWLAGVCREERVDVVLSGVEQVLKVLAVCSDDLRRETGTATIVSPPEVLAIGDDKLVTAQWLAGKGLNNPASADANDRAAVEALNAACGFPLIAKPRGGKGSAGIAVLRSSCDLEAWSGRSGYVIQEYLGDEECEYTAGCFSDREGHVRGCIVLWRELQQGSTYKAVVGEFPEVRAEALRIAALLKPTGPCNIQMRMHRNRPVCFEINIRFSGTAAMRARFGFNDVEAAIRHYVLGEPAVDLPHVTQGVALRYWNEIYPDDAARRELESSGRLMNPRASATLVENYGMRQ